MTDNTTITELLNKYKEAGDERLYLYQAQEKANEYIRTGRQRELHEEMKPFYQDFCMPTQAQDWWLPYTIVEIAKKDPGFSAWAQRQDVKLMADALARYGDGGKTLRVFDLLMAANYELTSPDVSEQAIDELRMLRVSGDQHSGEVYCLLHAFVTILCTSHRHDLHKQLYQLLRSNWDFMKHFYSVMTERIVGMDFQNFVQVANNLDNAKYRPFLHLIYWLLADKSDVLCQKSSQIKKMEKALVRLSEHMDETDQNHDLDQLCQTLFPEEIRQMLEEHPMPLYRQLRNDVDQLRQELSDSKARLKDLDKQVEEIRTQTALQLSQAVEQDSIPFAEIEGELLDLPAKDVPYVFEKLNDMLGGNDVWHKHFKELRKKVRAKAEEAVQPKIVDKRNITLTGERAEYNEGVA